MTNIFEQIRKEMGGPIQYEGLTYVISHKLPVSYGDELVFSIETTNYPRLVGFSVDVSGTCELNGRLIDLKKGKKQGVNMFFWEDTVPPEIKIKVFPLKDHIWVRGARQWPLSTEEESLKLGHRVHTELGYHHDYSSAMRLEKIDNGWRYHCCHNTYNPITQKGYDNFDAVVFTACKVQK